MAIHTIDVHTSPSYEVTVGAGLLDRCGEMLSGILDPPRKIAIITDSRGIRRKFSPSPIFHRAISTDGRRLGAITGAEINELSFIVESLELSNGLWDDLFNRRGRVIHYTVNSKTGDVIIDDPENEREDTLHEERND